MPKKRNSKTNWLFVGIALLVAILVVLAVAAWFGVIDLTFLLNFLQSPSVSPNAPTNPMYHVYLNLQPASICVGASTIGIITSNIPNGICTLYVSINNQPAHFLANMQLDSSGRFTQTSGAINSAGTAVFQAFCCDANHSCAASNKATLTVTNCNNPQDGQQMPCAQIMPAVAENCNHGACTTGTCAFVPATLVTRARCECQTGSCSIGTADCMGACRSRYGIDAYASQCGAGSCPIGWYTITGESSCSSQGSCDRCCCQPQPS